MSQPSSSKTRQKVKYDNHQFASKWHEDRHYEALEDQARIGNLMSIGGGILAVIVIIAVIASSTPI